MSIKLCCRRQARHANKTEKSSTSTIAIAEQKCSESTVTTPSTATEAVATSPITAMASKTSVGESSSKQPSFLDDVDYDRVGMQEEGTSRATLTKHRRQQTMGSYEKSTNDSPAPCDSLGSSIDDVFYSSQIHKENEFRERKKISKSQMRGIFPIKILLLLFLLFFIWVLYILFIFMILFIVFPHFISSMNFLSFVDVCGRSLFSVSCIACSIVRFVSY